MIHQGPGPITDAILARAASYAARWRSMASAAGVSWDDVVATARAALVTAERRYDPTRGDFWPFARPWVAGAINRLIESERRHEDRRVALGFSDPEDPTPDPSTQLDADDARVAIVNSLDALPAFPARVISLAFGFEDGSEWADSKIAFELGVSRSTVKATKDAALETLRQVLSEKYRTSPDQCVREVVIL